jgi:hypothetical protein
VIESEKFETVTIEQSRHCAALPCANLDDEEYSVQETAAYIAHVYEIA